MIVMQQKDFPALFRSADELSTKSQKHFFNVLKGHVGFSMLAVILTIFNDKCDILPVFQLLCLLGTLASSIYLFTKRPDKLWYSGRAVAESIKTITWRYICRAEPFEDEDLIARNNFQNTLSSIVKQNEDFAKNLIEYLNEPQITNRMDNVRSLSLEERKEIYKKDRVSDQLNWYAKKAKLNNNFANLFFWLLVGANAFAILFSIFRIANKNISMWWVDTFIVIAASILAWMQAKRFSELSASYSLAAHEISLIKEKNLYNLSEKEFSVFIGDAENAFSREHTQWVARKDV